MHTITLFRQAGSWVARHSDPRVIELFGTDTLPTTWTDTANPENVYRNIRDLNPGALVYVRVLGGRVG